MAAHPIARSRPVVDNFARRGVPGERRPQGRDLVKFRRVGNSRDEDQ